MVDFIKQDMTDIWASSGDMTAPDPSKIATGWIVEAVPRQWWNWFENRQDTNIAYMLQKGIPEWDIVTEYQTNKSYVQRNNVVYKCIVGNAGLDPATTPANWVKAFPESSDSLEAIRTLTPAADRVAYYTGTNTAALMTVTAFARTLLDDANVTTMRATLGAQATHPNLTALSGAASPATNTLAYFNSATTMIVTPFTAFGRSLIDDADAAAARATLEVDSAADVEAALSAGLATKQMLSATLTALAGVSTSNNTISYWTGLNTAASTPLTAFARTLLDDADAATMRGTLSVYSTVDSDSNLTAGLATRQPLDATLTALAGLATGVNQLAYATGTDTFAQTTLTAFARSILDDADAVTVRGTIGADDAANLTTGTLALARLPADLVGKNAATATALQTSRTIQGVPFNGTANITLSVVDKDSGVGSATLPAGTTAQRTASPVNGQLRYNSDNNEFEGYINGSWGGIGGGTPLFTVLWWPSRTAIPVGYVASDGQLLTRTTYSAAWARVSAGDVPSVSDATWLATSTSRGAYSLGDGSTTFRIPDLNGKQSGTLAAPFLRGDGTNSTGVAGQFQGSDNLSHTHGFTQAAVRNTYPSVVGYSLNTAAAGYADLSTSVIIANSGGVESRPVNVTGVFIIKLIGGASDLTQEDASVAVAALENKLLYVSGRNRIINGDARINARGTSVVATAGVSAYGGADRFRAVNNANGSFTQSATTIVDPITGVAKTAIKQTVNTAVTTLTTTSHWGGFQQPIEGYNAYDLVNSPVVVSFLFNSNVTGTFTFLLGDGTSSQSYVNTFTAVANTPIKVSFATTIPSAAVVPASSSMGLNLRIGCLNTGTYQTSTLGSWQAGNFLAANTNTNWGATAGNFIAITDLQLEKGTVASEYERLSISTQLAQCQRYYGAGSGVIAGYNAATGNIVMPVSFKTSMRAVPSVAVGQSATNNMGTVNPTAQTFDSFQVYAPVTATGNSSSNFVWTAEAEL